MHPFIRPGDRVTVLLLPAGQKEGIRPGDCVVFLDEAKRWVVHRVIAAAPGSGKFLTKGDALPRADRPAGSAAIAGRVTAVERAGSGRTYHLDRPLPRLLEQIIAGLSRGEAALLFPNGRRRSSGSGGIFNRLVKSPRWILTRVFFP